ncbi:MULTISPECIES: hypothetical protein [Thalassospira]|uniref:Uncharacterized protein n=1 Tax=Thalassospira povalilytica TaxID=732237 RepID=A0A8I1SHP0_9PROT|nr:MULTISPECIES: hypothetical protein [Thalassospira]MEE3046252.1 hypothetical protein [Pseudomonadota bacterium]RCK22408.1 hypothetical protein TH8_15875 [Thalassospira profundimaris]KZB69806.1 hypothetical protein AUQ42_10375 [Thalassospira sp. MCCC 1A02491]MBN8196537.1 hypothetical protein [Thalassospira povalilytica]MBO6773024.1 hypothetical protein [Thalassospira sp.]
MREIRCIVFEDGELIKALVAHGRRTGKSLPPGQISSFEIERSKEVVARMTITSDEGQKTVIPTSGAQLAAAMIAYCIDRKVPVPAHAAKSITVIDDHVALKITMAGD